MQKQLLFCLVCSLLSPRVLAGADANDYAAITRNNAFRLHQPRRETNSKPSALNLPVVSLSGLAFLFDEPQALLRIQTKTPEPADELGCILTRGEFRDGIELTRIDMETGRVWIRNHGENQVLNLRSLE